MARWRMLYTTGTFYFIVTVARWGCGAAEWLRGGARSGWLVGGCCEPALPCWPARSVCFRG
eukprot:4557270-Prymnesium_polylepis.1